MSDKKTQSKGRAMTAPKGAKSLAKTESREERDRRLAMYAGQSFDDVDAEEFTGGMTSKETLVGVDLKIVDATFQSSTRGPGEYAIISALTRDLGIVTFSDGSQFGVCGQVRKHLDEGGSLPLRARQGLKYRPYKNQAGIDCFSWDLVGTPSVDEAKAVAAVGKVAGRRTSNGAARV